MFKKLRYTFLLFLLLQINVNAQDAYRMRKLASYNNPSLPKVDGTDIWNDLTGYYDPIKNREYIICGGTDSIYVFDITDAANMKRIAAVSGASIFAKNRDYETFQHYAYCVSDQGSGIGALQIFDLQYLPDSFPEVYHSNVLGTYTHTIFVDSVSERLYMSSNSKPGGFSAMDIISISDPIHPVFLAELTVPTKSGGFPLFNVVHEMFAKNDTVYLSCGEAGLYIFDLRNLADQRLIGSINSYPDQGYNHSSWLDKTGKKIMFTDENAGLDIKIFDISSMNNPKFISQFNSNTFTTSHNAYWYGNFAYVSAYHDGVVVYDITDPSNPIKAAWYDTHPVSPEVYGGYKGCWGIYPYLPSKHIIASDLTAGIFVFEIDSALLGSEEIEKIHNEITVFPNPSNGKIKISKEGIHFNQIKVFNTFGELQMQLFVNENRVEIDLSYLAQGLYFIECSSADGIYRKKILKQ